MAASEKPSVLIFGMCMHSLRASLALIHYLLRCMYVSHVGGLNTWSRNIAQALVPLDGEPLVSVCMRNRADQLHRSLFSDDFYHSQSLRIVDKYSVSPPTT